MFQPHEVQGNNYSRGKIPVFDDKKTLSASTVPPNNGMCFTVQTVEATSYTHQKQSIFRKKINI